VKRREIVQALRDGSDEFVNHVHGPRAGYRLRDLELAVAEDVFAALPFISDKQLADRILMAPRLASACRKLIEAANSELPAMVDRSIPEVQDFFLWLHWNLENGQKGETLPPAADLPVLQRGVQSPDWARPAGLAERRLADN